MLRERLEGLGFVEAGPEEAPDVCVFNTCTVTHVSDQKVRHGIRHAARQWPGAALYVTGCSAVHLAEKLRALPGVRGVFAPEGHDEMAAEWALVAGRTGGPAPARGIESFAGHGRGLVKIQEGCNNACSYCIVPAVRGPARSRPVDEIVHEARRLADAGFEEIVLTGTHIGLFGVDMGGGASLAWLLPQVLAAVPRARLRISSLEVVELTPELIRTVAESAGRVCPHFHLPLQSGDDAILRAMRRPYTREDFQARVDRLRADIEAPGVTTDVIVGFPGETSASFEQTLALCRRIGFSRLHVFPFSPRPGTPAADMPDRPRTADVSAWTRELRAAGAELAEAFAGQWVGREVEVVPERLVDAGHASGYTERYVHAVVSGEGLALKRRVRARVTGVAGEVVACAEEAGRGRPGTE